MVAAMAPGCTHTKLGGSNATWSVEDSVANQRRVIATLGHEHSGCFLNLLGETVQW